MVADITARPARYPVSSATNVLRLLLLFLDRPNSLFAVRSNDGGATFTQRERVATVRAQGRRLRSNLLRVFPLPSAGVDGGGSVYVAWSDCRFRAGFYRRSCGLRGRSRRLCSC